MSVTIMLIVLCNILCSLESVSVDVDNEEGKNSDDIVVKLPRTITDGSVMVIKGTFNSTVDSLIMKVSGDELKNEEECYITFKPNERILEITSQYGSTKTSYQLGNARGIVPFTFRMLARSKGDTVETDLIHIFFEGNKAGEHSLEIPCTFASFKNVDKMLFSGIKHIKKLIFDYQEIKDDR